MLSRAKIAAGLVPNQWVCVFQKEEAVGSVVYNYHGVSLHIKADAGYNAATVGTQSEANQGNVTVIIQDSNDGIAWTTRYTNKDTPLVPGGTLDVNLFQQGRFMRVLATSTGRGVINVLVETPEEQCGTGTWPDGPTTLACSTYCEVDCETGAETAG